MMPSSSQNQLARSLPHNHPKGFSLLEMTVVIAIIALLIGGILGGKSLIDSAQLRSVVRESQTYIAATKLFREKYIALPGDFSGATAIWGAAAAGASCTTTVAPTTGSETCDGNGDGSLTMLTTSAEPFRAWQHLANAGFIDGHYDGIDHAYGGNSYWPTAGVNVPTSKLKPGGYNFVSVGTLSGNANMFDGMYGLSLFLTAAPATGSYTWNFSLISEAEAVAAPSRTTPLLSAQDAQYLDEKLDDGYPSSGNIRSFKHAYQANCATADDSTAIYNLSGTSSSTPNCALVLMTGY